MKTISETKARIMLIFLMSLFVSGTAYSCSGAGEIKDSSTAREQDKKVLIFNKSEDGKDTEYRVEYSGDEMTSLEVNGEKIKKEDYDKYSDVINDEVDAMGGQGEHFDSRMPHMKHFKSFTTSFDTQLFSGKMQHLSDKLSRLKDIDIHINKDWDWDNDLFMDDLDDIDVDLEDININIDFDKLNSELKKASEEIKKSAEEIKKIDMPALKKELLRVKEDLRRAGRELISSNAQLKKMNSFIAKLKEEMVKDKLIKSTSEDFNLKIEDGDFYINDKKIDDKLSEKYKKMYREEVGGDIHKRVRINVR